MSLLWKLKSSDRLLIKNGFLSISAYYSRRSKSKEFDSFYKVISAKPNIRDRVDSHFQEGGPNWEIFNPQGSRFYLPYSLGPGWQNGRSTVKVDNLNISDLVDFESQNNDKLHFSVKRCPSLIRNNLQELFPFILDRKKSSELVVITLSYRKDTEVDNAAKNFVLVAREMCRILHTDDYWADFINPFSGKPFYHSPTNQKLYDNRLISFGTKYEDQDNCLVITSDDEASFSGSIFAESKCSQDELMWTFLHSDLERKVFEDDDDDDDLYY